jgi:hypothetical protein
MPRIDRGRRLIRAGALVAAMLVASPALAWRETGHWVVCEIAHRKMRPAARAALDAFLGGKEFAPQCTWPDMVRNAPQWKHTYEWHFVNFDDGEAYFGGAPPHPKGDVLRALVKAEAVLRDPAAAPADRLTYLRFLAHFAGDSHQPLHAGRRSDLGGTRMLVSWFGAPTFQSVEILRAAPPDAPCTAPGATVDPATSECVKPKVSTDDTTLHKVWDLQLLQHYMEVVQLRPEAGDSPEYMHKAYATRILREVPEPVQAAAPYTVFYDWTSESAEDRARAYAIPPPDADGRSALGEAYYDANIGYVNRRLVEAGLRLATTLNRVFDPAGDDGASHKFWEMRSLELEARLSRLVRLSGVHEL